ncbi:indole-3-glycerol phosphate synthase [Catalinimonas alkaloidigena]|uniref:Indole-3-glycerol phosphate synthase n=1 Tax=Catalinimonas alkaloidigena TaxID=1075417 RepID=A0A1G9IXK9_9BACT|nr:indole-3-glycerol phosphate synthase TrpC [Catalinimonas alkaloidigena]SDL29822.1 indole-3-glycerol phosphate synthase [Catalinimonas alkaloidigena]
MSILDEIMANRRKEVEERKALYPVALLEKSIFFETKPVSLRKYVLREDKSGIIAEYKRKSPSKGMINKFAPVERTTIGYMQAGASALSVLTDTKYFAGKNEDLQTARKFNFCPILRKDFMLDEYQVFEAKSIGADAILIIAAALDLPTAKQLTDRAHALNMEVLLEVHNREELERYHEIGPDLIGVNNRNLKTFETTIQTSLELAEQIPQTFVKVSESGISDPQTILRLREYGYRGFLIGETFMRSSRPEQACADFIKRLHTRGEKVVENAKIGDFEA